MRESFLTHRAASLLARQALLERADVVLDATNLDETSRRGAYRAAHEAGADVLVAFVQAPRDARAARAAAADAPDRPDRKRGEHHADPAMATRAAVVLRGTDDACSWAFV